MVLAAAVEQGGALATSRCAVVFNDTTTDGTAHADANAESADKKPTGNLRCVLLARRRVAVAAATRAAARLTVVAPAATTVAAQRE